MILNRKLGYILVAMITMGACVKAEAPPARLIVQCTPEMELKLLVISNQPGETTFDFKDVVRSAIAMDCLK
jgi:hypothetical protein